MKRPSPLTNRPCRWIALGLAAVSFISVQVPGAARAETKRSLFSFKKHDMSYGVHQEEFGKTELGTQVEAFTLVNRQGLSAKIITYGAMLTELNVPDRDGKLGDVVLGFDNLKQYLDGHPYLGCTTGRVANRIAKGTFMLNGNRYSLAINNPPNHLHGGDKGIDKKVWKGVGTMTADGPAVRMSYMSPDGEEGYPGNLWIVVTYTLTNANELRIDYEATCDQDTPVNLTNHSYFNLKDNGLSSIVHHSVQIFADNYTPVDGTMIPTGKIAPVQGTPLDFTSPAEVGPRLAQLPGDGAADPGGIDHNFVLRERTSAAPRLAARVVEPITGRVMEVLTTEPGIQFYTGNFLDGSLAGKGGHRYFKNHGLCLETQHFPDSVNQPSFPSIILKVGQTYHQTTVHRFSTQ